jgi:hypothetical protein
MTHETGCLDSAVTGPTTAAVRAAVERIAQSPQLRTSPRLVAFLRYVVECKLAGQSARIKSYAIAVDALHRDPSFNPQVDPIVRVEAGRLRHALARYYEDGEASDPVLIDLPRGTYVPIFRLRGVQDPEAPAGVLSEKSAKSRPAEERQSVATLRRDLEHSWAAFQELFRLHQRQLESISTEIAKAQQRLAQSNALR